MGTVLPMGPMPSQTWLSLAFQSHPHIPCLPPHMRLHQDHRGCQLLWPTLSRATPAIAAQPWLPHHPLVPQTAAPCLAAAVLQPWPVACLPLQHLHLPRPTAPLAEAWCESLIRHVSQPSLLVSDTYAIRSPSGAVCVCRMAILPVMCCGGEQTACANCQLICAGTSNQWEKEIAGALSNSEL